MIALWIVCVAVLVALDQWIKYWAFTVLQPVGEIPVIEGFFSFTYLENTGAAFGLMDNWRWFFVALTVVVMVVIVVYYFRLPRERKSWLIRVPLIFVSAGALGNCIDRIRNGFVIDMLEFRFIRFPVFNAADVMLVCGTLVLAFVLIFIVKEPA